MQKIIIEKNVPMPTFKLNPKQDTPNIQQNVLKSMEHGDSILIDCDSYKDYNSCNASWIGAAKRIGITLRSKREANNHVRFWRISNL